MRKTSTPLDGTCIAYSAHGAGSRVLVLAPGWMASSTVFASCSRQLRSSMSASWRRSTALAWPSSTGQGITYPMIGRELRAALGAFLLGLGDDSRC